MIQTRVQDHTIHITGHVSSDADEPLKEALIERLLAEVRSFCGEVAQEDDMTCVVVRVEA